MTFDSGTIFVANANAGATLNFPPGMFRWTGGTIKHTETGGSPRPLNNAGSITLDGAAAKTLAGNGGSLVNTGNIVQAGAGELVIGLFATLDNQFGGVIDLRSDAGITLGAAGNGGMLRNAGTIRKSAGGPSAIVFPGTGILEDAAGHYEVQVSTLVIRDAAGTNFGTYRATDSHYTAAAGSSVELGVRLLIVGGTVDGAGAGSVVFSNGTMFAADGGATLNFPPGMFQWTGGTIQHTTTGSNPQTITNAGQITLAGSSVKNLFGNGGALANTGTIIHPAGIELNLGVFATLNNQAGGLYDMLSDAAITGSGILANSGLFRKSGGTGESLLRTLRNTGGTLEVQSGRVALDTVSGVIDGANFVVAAGSEFELRGHLGPFTGTFTGSGGGRVLLNPNNPPGDVTITEAGATFDFPAGFFHWMEGLIFINYFNTGETDLPAPLLLLKTARGQLRLNEPGSVSGTSPVDGEPVVTFLATNPDGPPSVLPPGAHGSASFTYQTDSLQQADLEVEKITGLGLILWDRLKDSICPDGIAADAWDAIFANFLASVGATQAQYAVVLRRNADYLAEIGQPTQDVNKLLRFELQRAGLFGAIASRYRLGAFGRGRSDPTDNRVVLDGDGNAAVHLSGGIRHFTRQSDGSFAGRPGENATLTETVDGFTLTEIDGSITRFQAGGLLDFIEDPNGNRVTANYAAGRLASFSDSLGNTTTYDYNADGRIVRVTDFLGVETLYEFDASGEHLARITDPTGSIEMEYITEGTPGQLHAIKTLTLPDGTHRFYEYDAVGRLTQSFADGGAEAVRYFYDEGPGVVTTRDAVGTTLTLYFDVAGQVAKIIDGLGRTTRYQYNADHELIGVIDTNGFARSLARDEAGNDVESSDPGGQVVTASYGALNTLREIRDPRGNAVRGEYDARGNLLTSTYPDGTTTTFQYDAIGRVVATSNRRGQTTTFQYNSDNTLASRQTADGTETFAYDARRNLVTITDPSGTIEFEYDAADRVTKFIDASCRSLEFTYDAAGRRTSTTDQDGVSVHYVFNALGRMTAVTDDADQPVIEYSYDAAGRIARADAANGTATVYDYDTVGRILALTNLAPDDSLVSFFGYEYDTRGQPVRVTTTDGVTEYGYDATGQLTSVSLPSGRTITYEYDAAGNRVRAIDDGVVEPYTANNLNQYSQAGAATFAYDDEGNLVRRTDSSGVTTYNYNADGRLIGVTTPTDAFRYDYDALGHRVAMTHNGQRTEFLIDPFDITNVVAEYDGGGALSARNFFGLGLVSRTTGGGSNSFFYAFDGSGNTSDLTDDTGAAIDHYEYLPFGEMLAGGTVENPFTFVGAAGVESRGDGLYFMRNRSYDAALGRFTAPDPIGLAADLNLYRYVGNSPVLFTDAVGLADDVRLGRATRNPVQEGSVVGLTDSPTAGVRLNDQSRVELLTGPDPSRTSTTLTSGDPGTAPTLTPGATLPETSPPARVSFDFPTGTANLNPSTNVGRSTRALPADETSFRINTPTARAERITITELSLPDSAIDVTTFTGPEPGLARARRKTVEELQQPEDELEDEPIEGGDPHDVGDESGVVSSIVAARSSVDASAEPVVRAAGVQRASSGSDGAFAGDIAAARAAAVEAQGSADAAAANAAAVAAASPGSAAALAANAAAGAATSAAGVAAAAAAVAGAGGQIAALGGAAGSGVPAGSGGAAVAGAVAGQGGAAVAQAAGAAVDAATAARNAATAGALAASAGSGAGDAAAVAHAAALAGGAAADAVRAGAASAQAANTVSPRWPSTRQRVQRVCGPGHRRDGDRRRPRRRRRE